MDALQTRRKAPREKSQSVSLRVLIQGAHYLADTIIKPPDSLYAVPGFDFQRFIGRMRIPNCRTDGNAIQLLFFLAH